MIKIFQSLIKQFLNAFLQAYLNYLVSKIGTTADRVVSLANSLESNASLTGEEKAKELLSKLKLISISTGKEVRDNTLEIISKQAVAVVRGGAL